MCEQRRSLSSREQAVTSAACLPCRYRAALDAAVGTGQVEIVANLLEELAARQGLASALGGGPRASPAPACWSCSRMPDMGPRLVRALADKDLST